MHYNNLLRELGKKRGILGQIFTKSQNKITDPARLYKLIALMAAEHRVIMSVKDKGDIYEGLLEKNAEDTKSGAGQYFTPYWRAATPQLISGAPLRLKKAPQRVSAPPQPVSAPSHCISAVPQPVSGPPQVISRG